MMVEMFDPGIQHEVVTLRAAGVETFESCQGGDGHAYTEPTVRFHGGAGEGYRALGIAIVSGLAVMELRHVWPIVDGDATGPWWELTFRRQVDASKLAQDAIASAVAAERERLRLAAYRQARAFEPSMEGYHAAMATYAAAFGKPDGEIGVLLPDGGLRQPWEFATGASTGAPTP